MGMLAENGLVLDFSKNLWLGMQEHADESTKHYLKMVSTRIKYNKMSQCSSVRHA